FGQPIARVRRRIAYVPQTEAVDWDFPVTVLDVALMGRYVHHPWWRWPGRRDREAALDALRRVGMADFAERHLRQLSGGQQRGVGAAACGARPGRQLAGGQRRRVFLAPALCRGAALLLLDGPFAGVDAATEHAIFDLIDRMAAEGKTLVVVNHDLSVLARF